MSSPVSNLKYAKIDRKHGNHRTSLKPFKKACSRAERRSAAKLIQADMD